LYPEDFDPDNYNFPNSVCIYPDGRTSLSDAVGGDLRILLGSLYMYQNGVPVSVDYPTQGLQLADGSSSIHLCDGMVNYLVRDPAYYFFGDQPIYGGGHSNVDSSGDPIASAILFWAPGSIGCGVVPLELYFNSPDIDGSGAVNLTDLVYFLQDYNGSYSYRSDFDFDGDVDDDDRSVITGALGACCN